MSNGVTDKCVCGCFDHCGFNPDCISPLDGIEKVEPCPWCNCINGSHQTSWKDKSTNQRREYTLLPKPSGKNASGGNSNYAPFLKAKDISGKSVLAVITSLTARKSQFSDFDLGLKIAKKEWTMSFKLGSGNHKALFNIFGANEKKMIGKKIRLEKAVYLKKKYVKITAE